jgi:hypothetical protein
MSDEPKENLFSHLPPADRLVALQAAASALAQRYQLASYMGFDSYGGLRNFFQALGFKEQLTVQDYRQRYKRGGIAKTLIDRLPEEMWDDGVYIRESEYDPNNLSEYEIESARLWERLSIDSRLMKADKLAGLGSYSVVLIGVKETGEDLSQPLSRLNGPDDIIYLLQYAEDNAKVLSLVTKTNDPLFGRPEFYEINTISNVSASSTFHSAQSSTTPKKVHRSRIIHVAHGLLESDWIGTPDLEASWNDLDSLFKIAWGGPEAAWRKMDMGIQWDVDPEYDQTTPAAQELLRKMNNDIVEMRHQLRRDIKTSGVTAKPLAGTVDKYGPNGEFAIKLIAGTNCLPYTMLVGEELGLRAGENNRESLNIAVQGRRKQIGTPLVRQLQDRLISVNGLPKPRSKDGKYNVVWGVEEELGEEAKAGLAKLYADANKAQSEAGGGLMWETNEIRDKVGDEPKPEEEIEEEEIVDKEIEEEDIPLPMRVIK